jgi:photosystem II stability/assembly factor-like uncharacterized protein
MRKYLFIFSISIVNMTTSSQAQEWVKITPTFDPPGNYSPSYSYGSFVDGRNGWMVSGPKKYVWHTSNGGNLWKSLGDDIALERIEFIDTLHGWIFGAWGPDNKYSLLITKNGGLNWTTYSIPTFVSIRFLDSLNGFAGGEDTIYATTNGGVTWIPQDIAPYARFGVTDIFFVDRSNAWAVGGSSDFWDAGIILNTIDGGKHWKVNSHPTSGVNSRVFFTDTLHGYVVGSGGGSYGGAISVTTNGGVDWKFHSLASQWLNDIAFTNDSTGWAIGDGGFIWKTANKGLNWNKVESGTTSVLRRIFFFDHGRLGYILGDNETLLKYTETVDVRARVASSERLFHLLQNYPNPFNPTTTIEYSIPKNAFVTLQVFDLLGNTVVTLVNQVQNAGSHYVDFDGASRPSGIYLYRLNAANFLAVKKFVLLK